MEKMLFDIAPYMIGTILLVMIVTSLSGDPVSILFTDPFPFQHSSADQMGKCLKLINIVSSSISEKAKVKAVPQLLAVVSAVMAGITSTGLLRFLEVPWQEINYLTFISILGEKIPT